jgi:hypothetical protein
MNNSDVNILRPGQKNAEIISSKRLCPKTKSNYSNKIAILTKWIRTHSSFEVSSYYDEQNENIKLPIPAPILIEFFGFIGAQDGVTQVNENNENNDDNATSTTHYRAFSTVSGYRSAIVDLYCCTRRIYYAIVNW